MHQCWANGIGSCDGGISLEHYISRSAFDADQITVKGFHWCRDQAKTISIQSFGRNMLCRRHNSSHQEVDNAGVAAFRHFREIHRLNPIRSELPRQHWVTKQFELNGNYFERWFLKTLINFSYDSPLKLGLDATSNGRPSQRLTEMVFGKRDFDGNAGLYLLLDVGMGIRFDEGITIAPIQRNLDSICGGLFTFRGMYLLLWVDTDRPPKDLSRLEVEGNHFQGVRSLFHPTKINVKLNGMRSCAVVLKWRKSNVSVLST